jgi:hypothetical protein
VKTASRLLLAGAIGLVLGIGGFAVTAVDTPIQAGTFSPTVCGDYPPTGRQFDPWTGMPFPTARPIQTTPWCAQDPGLAGHRAMPVPLGFLVGWVGSFWLLGRIRRREASPG